MAEIQISHKKMLWRCDSEKTKPLLFL